MFQRQPVSMHIYLQKLFAFLAIDDLSTPRYCHLIRVSAKIYHLTGFPTSAGS
jgi:hypothetical protein